MTARNSTHKKKEFFFRGMDPGPTGQLVDFLGSEFQKSGPCHIVLHIKERPNNYLIIYSKHVFRSEKHFSVEKN